MQKINFSIIVPVYNEEKRIPRSINQIFSFFNSCGDAVEVIFVSDGSTDDTEKVLESYQAKQGFKIIKYGKNRGKGYAVRQGVLAASGRWIIFFDIDLAVPLSEFSHFKSFVADGDQVIIGSRRLMDSRINKREHWLREFLGAGFSALSRVFVREVADFTCGFKCFSKQATEQIFPIARINRWAFDTELLYIAKLKRMPIRQMPVEWSHDDDSRVRVWKDALVSLKELAQIKINQLRGLYV